MKINLKVRAKNASFWITLIPAIAVFITALANVFGYQLELTGISDKLIEAVKALFVILAILGIVIDPTTDGLSDSERALNYDKPFKEEE